ncbi:MAG: aminoacyl-tRNA hydrolase [Clostridiales bacterium]|nr:aminoacyl-tRNA hydrolase [Clostridiales bacterium]
MIGQWIRDRFQMKKEEDTVMYIIAGLGNPGRKYEHTRHNAGYEAIDRLAEKYGIRIETEKFRALTGTGYIEGQKVLLLKPLTFMNASGESIRAACDFYKIDPRESFLVLYDDISLPTGQLRVRGKGSAGGHNGIKNIIAQLGTQEFARVKIGVGEKPKEYDLVDYVLGHFSEEEWAAMTEAFSHAADAAAMLLTGDLQAVMNRYNAHVLQA